MPANKLQLRIFTSEAEKVNEPVDMVIFSCIVESEGRRSSVGDMGVLPGHIPCSAVLGIKPFRILNEGVERQIAVLGGVINIRDNVVVVMTEKAEWPEEIDRSLAEHDLAEAKRVRETISDDVELRKNQILIRRLQVQVEVSAYPLIHGK